MHRHTNIQTYRHTDTDIQAYRYRHQTYRYRHTGIQVYRHQTSDIRNTDRGTVKQKWAYLLVEQFLGES